LKIRIITIFNGAVHKYIEKLFDYDSSGIKFVSGILNFNLEWTLLLVCEY